MKKYWDILVAFILITITLTGIHYLNQENIKMNKELEVLEQQIQQNKQRIEYNDYRITYPEEYLEIPDKEQVAKVIDDYYKQFETYVVKTKTYYQPNIDGIAEYIKKNEGFHAKPYRDGCLIKTKNCPKSQYRYSIGYGTLAKSKNDIVTKEEAENRLYSHIKQTIWPKMKGVKYTSIQQYYASIDFAYNAGHNAFANNIVNDEMEVDCAKMMKYVYFNGKVNKGLEKRRMDNFLRCVSYDEDDFVKIVKQ